jgi:hypothetical protein
MPSVTSLPGVQIEVQIVAEPAAFPRLKVPAPATSLRVED